MKTLLLALIFTALAPLQMAHADCDADEIYIKDYQTCLGLQWIEGPYLNARGERAFSTLRLTFTSERELDLTHANVYPWMIMQGGHQHGSRPVQIEVVDNTELIVRGILLTQMMGKWFIRINLDATASDSLERDFEAQIAL